MGYAIKTRPEPPAPPVPIPEPKSANLLASVSAIIAKFFLVIYSHKKKEGLNPPCDLFRCGQNPCCCWI